MKARSPVSQITSLLIIPIYIYASIFLSSFYYFTHELQQSYEVAVRQFPIFFNPLYRRFFFFVFTRFFLWTTFFATF